MLKISEARLPLPEYLVEQMRETPQNPLYHAEGNVLNHTLMVLEQYQLNADQFELSAEEHTILYWASLLHDIGKPKVTYWTGDRWTARGHEKAGVSIARDLLLAKSEISAWQRKQILDLVRWHHIPLRWGLRLDNWEKYACLATKLDLRLLGIFSYFDLKGRKCINQAQVEDITWRFLHDIVPEVELRLGNFQHIQEFYNISSRNIQDKLWEASHKGNALELEELFCQTNPDILNHDHENLYCIVPIGLSTSQKVGFIEENYSELLWWSTPELAEKIDPDLDALHRFIAACANKKQSFVLNGWHIQAHFRYQISRILREYGFSIRYIFFENQLKECLDYYPSRYAHMVRTAYEQYVYPHPWEAHQITELEV